MAWKTLDTLRCALCRMFVPTNEVLYAHDGSAYCDACGPPPVRFAAEGGGVLRAARVTPPVLVAVAVGLTVVGFFAAAMLSQL